MNFDGLGRWFWADGLGLEDVLMAFEPMAVLTAFAAAILDSGVRIGNRCKLFPVYTLFCASILDFKPKLGNRCKLFPGFGPGRASILDFRPKLGNRCKLFPV